MQRFCADSAKKSPATLRECCGAKKSAREGNGTSLALCDLLLQILCFRFATFDSLIPIRHWCTTTAPLETTSHRQGSSKQAATRQFPAIHYYLPSTQQYQCQEANSAVLLACSCHLKEARLPAGASVRLWKVPAIQRQQPISFTFYHLITLATHWTGADPATAATNDTAAVAHDGGGCRQRSGPSASSVPGCNAG